MSILWTPKSAQFLTGSYHILSILSACLCCGRAEKGTEKEEKWYDIPSYEELYQVSSSLRVRGKDRRGQDGRFIPGRIIATYKKNKQPYVTLWRDGSHKEHNVMVLYENAEEKAKER